MAAEQTATVRLADYRPPAFLIDRTELVFRLDPDATRVSATIAFRPNPDAEPGQDLRLDGEGLRDLAARIDGAPVEPVLEASGLVVPAAQLPAGPFTWEADVTIAPRANTALEGLYMSKGMYCTQCEAEGFRKITYYPDRPDVMAPFRVRIEGDAPVLLSNGNPVASGPGWAEWDDPWPKPSYLFALVAGDLRAVPGAFTTASGREVALNVWVRPGDEDRCDYALGALKRSMRWDEEAYGREYDLDVFNVVAVDDFNMGAMENKGLNIFNSKYVLVSPETATDRDYEWVEGIIAHEYFHNWTGNRITCRDWFQLCLKEGLTVFRDREFTADMRSPAVKRIEDVLALRARQFREDAGPLAHPVRPESYQEINNFYTATVYDKGAEVIGMLKRLVGDEGYRAALDLYFERHDGQACTIEDWLKVFEDATGRDLSQFKRWYTQAGTPRLTVSDSWDAGAGRYTLTVRQSTPPTPGQPQKAPLVIPFAFGLLARDGRELRATEVAEITGAEQTIEIEGLPERPVPSLLRGFSAPVIVQRETPRAERLLLLAHDTDPFNRWEAGRSIARDTALAMILHGAAPPADFLDALATMAADEALDPAFRALALSLPTEDDLAQAIAEAGAVPEPAGIHAAHRALGDAVARALEPVLADLYGAMETPGPYSPDAEAAGRRALRGRALAYLSRRDGGARARAQFAAAGNMTDTLAALSALLDNGAGEAELAAFHDRFRTDRLVMDKWFALQVGLAAPERAAATARALTAHPLFDFKNPNRFRSVFGALAANHAGFHDDRGESYELLADWLIRLDPVNPQTTARMCAAYETWPRYAPERQAMMRAALGRIAETPGLSRDTSEMVSRILAA